MATLQNAVFEALRRGLGTAAVLRERVVVASRGVRPGQLAEEVNSAVAMWRLENRGAADDLDTHVMCQELINARRRAQTAARVKDLRSKRRVEDGEEAEDSQSPKRAAKATGAAEATASGGGTLGHTRAAEVQEAAAALVNGAEQQGDSQDRVSDGSQSQGCQRVSEIVSEWDFSRRCACIWVEGEQLCHERLVQRSPDKGPSSSVGAIFRIGNQEVDTRVRSIWWELITNQTTAGHRGVIRHLKQKSEAARRGVGESSCAYTKNRVPSH